MVSKNQKKLIRSLKTKKFRKQHQLFVAEGIKVIHEFAKQGFELEYLFVEKEQQSHFLGFEKKQILISEIDLKQISFLTTAQKALAVFRIKETPNTIEKGLQLVLDDIKDPGNLGTIIRLADWFGIEKIICSTQTVDCFNPKVVQSTMGSLGRVSVQYLDIVSYLEITELPIYGGFMEGESVYKATLPKKAIIVMGNEANGISKEITNLVAKKINIPRFGNRQAAESLNVATATAILLSEFRRS